MNTSVEQYVRAHFDQLQAEQFNLGPDFHHHYEIAVGEDHTTLLTSSPEAVAITLPTSFQGTGLMLPYKWATDDLMERRWRAGGGSLRVPEVKDILTTDIPSFRYALYQRLDGVSGGLREVRDMDDQERRSYGWAVGEYAGWLSLTVSVEELREQSSRYLGTPWPELLMGSIVELSNTFVQPTHRQPMEEMGHRVLMSAIAETENAAVRGNQLHNRRIAGHRDLQAGNIMFELHEGRRVPKGVIDSLVVPTAPEYELRHVWALGGVAASAAREAYEAVTGSRLDDERLTTWASLQRLGNYAYCLTRPNFWAGQDYVNDLLTDIVQLMPQYDWSDELDRRYSSTQNHRLAGIHQLMARRTVWA